MARSDGRDRREYYRQWNAANREHRAEYMRAYYAANKDRILANAAVSRLTSEYGLSPERLEEILVAQDGCCYLCGEPLDLEAKGNGKFHIDHDHSCCRGRKSCGSCVRGLACKKCNTGIGMFGDDPERMRRVADNLEMATRRLRDHRPGAAANPRPGHEAAAVTPRGDGRR